jgi:hypothetical protein
MPQHPAAGSLGGRLGQERCDDSSQCRARERMRQCGHARVAAKSHKNLRTWWGGMLEPAYALRLVRARGGQPAAAPLAPLVYRCSRSRCCAVHGVPIHLRQVQKKKDSPPTSIPFPSKSATGYCIASSGPCDRSTHRLTYRPAGHRDLRIRGHLQVSL